MNLCAGSGSRFGEADIDWDAALQFFLGPFWKRFLCGNSTAKRVVDLGPALAFQVKNDMLVGEKTRVAVLDTFRDIDTPLAGSPPIAGVRRASFGAA